MIPEITNRTFVTGRVPFYDYRAGASFVFVPPRKRSRSKMKLVFTVLAAVMVFADGLLLGYMRTTAAKVHAAAPDLPPPIIKSAPSLGRNEIPLYLGHPMSEYQQYTCDKFGADCGIALAIQAAENVKGDCEAYHYNSDGSLDWGYFQINSVHVTRRGVNLRSLLDCKANIDFAYQLYRQEGFRPWSTYVSGQYRKFLDDTLPYALLRRSTEPLLLPAGLSSR